MRCSLPRRPLRAFTERALAGAWWGTAETRSRRTREAAVPRTRTCRRGHRPPWTPGAPSAPERTNGRLWPRVSRPSCGTVLHEEGVRSHGVLSFAHDAWRSTSESAKELVRLLLTRDRHKRISAAAALRHPWLEADPLESARLKLQHGQISQREYEHLETLLLRDPTFERHEASRGAALRQETEALAREVGAVRDALREGQRSHEAMVQQLRDAWESERSALDQRAAQLSARLNALQKPRS